MSKPFDRIIIVMFENQYRSYVMQDPFMKKLASAGADMTNYFGAFHPSQTNYVASLAGELCAVTNDTPPASPLMQQTLVDLMEPPGEQPKASWRAYMEAYPGEAWNPAWASADYPASEQPLTEYPDGGTQLARYFRKHNAFASFHTIQASEERWGKIVDENAFWQDVNEKTLPDYCWFTPDIWNDGHYLYNTHMDTNPRTQLVPQMSTWLEYVFFGNPTASNVQGMTAPANSNIGLNLDIDQLLSDPETAYKNSRIPKGTLVVVTFDEADYDAVGYDTNYDGPNQIYTVLLGNMIKPGTQFSTPYNHYSLIKTVEAAFDLGSLQKNDADANWIRFLWDQKFSWAAPAPDTGLKPTGQITFGAVTGETIVVFETADGLSFSSVTDDTASKPQPSGLPAAAGKPFACTGVNDQLLLVYTDEADNLWSSAYANGCWSNPEQLDQKAEGQIALCSYLNQDGSQHCRLAWAGENGFIFDLDWTNGTWSTEPGAVGQLTDGFLAIGQLGPSLYLVYKERNTTNLRMTSYNLADFNHFKAVDFQGNKDKANDTSINKWSPMDFPVGNFAGKFNAVKNEYLHSGALAMASIEGEMHLIYRGPWADQNTVHATVFGLTGILTASSQKTNGYGTLNQAGWTDQTTLQHIEINKGGALAMTSQDDTLIFVYQDAASGELGVATGGYADIGPG